jgi:hypothetical protein
MEGTPSCVIATTDLVAVCGDLQNRGMADVICSCADPPVCDPLSWIRQTLRRWPGAMVAAVRTREHECVAGSRDTAPVTFELCSLGRGDVCPVLLSGCLLYSWLAGLPEPPPRSKTAS